MKDKHQEHNSTLKGELHYIRSIINKLIWIKSLLSLFEFSFHSLFDFFFWFLDSLIWQEDISKKEQQSRFWRRTREQEKLYIHLLLHLQFFSSWFFSFIDNCWFPIQRVLFFFTSQEQSFFAFNSWFLIVEQWVLFKH